MVGLDPSFCVLVKRARRAAKLSQGEIALELGCNQSALSAFENGNPTKLSDEVVEKLAKKFSIALPKSGKPAAAVTEAVPMVSATAHIHGFCPNPNCPSNHHYEVEGRELVRPDRLAADPAGGRFCALCGEVLERKCPNCGAPVHDGAICSFCGEPYLPL